MAHEQTLRAVPHAKTAVLFLHGITGSPEHFRQLIPMEGLVSEEYSCYNLLYPGHGSMVSDFSRSSIAAWKKHAFSVFMTLCDTHEKVIVVGHSMGTLFAIRMALMCPEKVSQLFLLAVPFRLGLRWFGVCNLLRFAFGKTNQNDPVQVATAAACGIQPTKKVWQYTGWIPRMLELLREMYATSKRASDIEVPCEVFQSCRDELVSLRSGKILEQNPNIHVNYLQDSTHFYYSDKDKESVLTAFRALL